MKLPFRQTAAFKLLVIAIKNAPEGRLTMSYDNLKSRIGVTQRAVVNLTQRLEKLGYLIVERNQNQANTYSLNEDFWNKYEEHNNG